MKARPHSSLVAGLCAATVAVALLPRFTFAQGSLTPPGPPAPTMFSLDQLGQGIAQANSKIDQIEPRTPIPSLPYAITQPGSYYLTKNLTDSPGNSGGITVQIDHVAIDLNGFQLIGANVSGTPAIQRVGNADYLVVRNGSIRDWAGGGIRVFGTVSCTVENVRVSNCNGAGIEVGGRSFLHNCAVVGTGGGISVAAISVGSDSIVKQCVALSSTGNGIQASGGASGVSISDCLANDNGTGFSVQDGCTIANCVANQNSATGFYLGGNCVVTRCTANGNNPGGSSGVGIATGNGCTVIDCVANENPTGISVSNGCTVTHCTARVNSTQAFSVSAECQIVGNNSEGSPIGFNVSASGNRIDGNTASVEGSGAGYSIQGSNNLIIRNSARANSIGTNQYPVSGSNNTIGVVIDLHASGGTVSNHEAWANFVY